MRQSVLCVFSLSICCITSAKPFAKGPYLGQTPPGSTAQVFAPGLICDTLPQTWEAFATFSADGNGFCFHTNEGVFITENGEQGWTKPKRVDIIRENHRSAWAPVIVPDANAIYYGIGHMTTDGPADIYRCSRKSGFWTVPEKMGPPFSSPSWEWTFSFAANNNLYIASGRGDIKRECSLWLSHFRDQTWTSVVHIPLNHQAADPGIASDESFMVFTAKNVSGGYGHRDLYITVRRPNGSWSTPRNMGRHVNSMHIEHGPRISPDKKYLFYTRSDGFDPRKHSADIYWVALRDYLPKSYR